MSVTIQQSQKSVQSIASEAKQVIKSKQTTTELVAELIEVQRKLAAIAASKLITRADAIKKALREEITSMGIDADQPYVFETEFGTVEFGPQSSTIKPGDNKLLMKTMGIDDFLACAKVDVTDLRKYLSGIELEKCTTPSRGSRTCKAIHSADGEL